MINYMKSPNSPDIPNSLNEHWMPFSSNKDFKKNPRLIANAKGVYLNTHEGHTLIDGSSGLYCNPLGHGRKEIIDGMLRRVWRKVRQESPGLKDEVATPALAKLLHTVSGSLLQKK